MTRLRALWASLFARPAAAAPPVPLDPRLVKHVSVFVHACCPCGSTIEHNLALHTVADCPRCGRSIGIRSIHYERTGVHHLPDARVSVGYVVTKATMRRTQPNGVH